MANTIPKNTTNTEEKPNNIIFYSEFYHEFFSYFFSNIFDFFHIFYLQIRGFKNKGQLELDKKNDDQLFLDEYSKFEKINFICNLIFIKLFSKYIFLNEKEKYNTIINFICIYSKNYINHQKNCEKIESLNNNFCRIYIQLIVYKLTVCNILNRFPKRILFDECVKCALIEPKDNKGSGIKLTLSTAFFIFGPKAAEYLAEIFILSCLIFGNRIPDVIKNKLISPFVIISLKIFIISGLIANVFFTLNWVFNLNNTDFLSKKIILRKSDSEKDKDRLSEVKFKISSYVCMDFILKVVDKFAPLVISYLLGWMSQSILQNRIHCLKFILQTILVGVPIHMICNFILSLIFNQIFDCEKIINEFFKKDQLTEEENLLFDKFKEFFDKFKEFYESNKEELFKSDILKTKENQRELNAEAEPSSKFTEITDLFKEELIKSRYVIG